MGFLSNVLSATGVGGILGIESDAEKAAKRAGRVQQDEANLQAEQIGASGESAISRFDPLSAVGQRGIDLAGFLGDPNQQASFVQDNPLFDLGLQNLNEQTNKSAASRSRLTAGDTLQQLQQNATLASQPLIDRQRQDILNLLNISQGAIGAQAGIEQNTAQNVANLRTGGAAAQAGGIIGAENAAQQGFGNLIDVAGLLAGVPPGTFSGAPGLAQPIPGGRNTTNSGFNMAGGL